MPGTTGVGGLVASYGPTLNTSASKSIEDRYSSGGGSRDHTPGSASPRGDKDKVEGNTQATSGMGSEAFRKQKEEMQGQ